MKSINSAATVVLVAALVGAAGAARADERTEGKVTGTKLTACSMKPGGCEGTLTLEPAGSGKNQPMTIKVPLGTMITKGKEIVYLPALRGKTVAVTHMTEKGERIARAVEVK